MAQDFILGMNGKLYYDATALLDTPDTGDWTLITNATNVTTSTETGETDVTTRANSGWRATATTLKDATIELELLYKAVDLAFDALEAAWEAGTEIAIAAMDGLIATVGSKGLAGNFIVSSFTRSEPLEEGMTVTVTLKPSSFTDWYVVEAS